MPLPPRNDTEAEVKGEWEFPSGVLNLGGQDFIFPEGCKTKAVAKWLDDDLLSVEIFIKAKVGAECARCLKPTGFEISDKLAYLYYTQGSGVLENDDLLPVEIDYFGRTIDVMPQISESIFTLLPSKVLCRDDCAGLCPICGSDLNEGPCSCKSESIDPRLDVLRDFVVEDEDT